MRRIVEITTPEEMAHDRRAALATVWRWVLALWWPATLVAVLVMSIHHTDDGDPTWRFHCGWDVLAFAGIVAALTLEVRAAIVWAWSRRP